MTKERNYAKEYKDFHGKPEEVKKRAERNAARSKMEKAGKVHKGDGKDVDHASKPLRKGGSNETSTLRVKPASENRGWRKGKKGYD